MYTVYMRKRKAEKATGRVAFSLQETALASGKTFSAVYQGVRSGKIPTSRMGRRHFVPSSYFAKQGLSLPTADKDHA